VIQPEPFEEQRAFLIAGVFLLVEQLRWRREQMGSVSQETSQVMERPSIMHPRFALIILFALSFLAPAVAQKSSVTTPPDIPPFDRSFYLGQPVHHPEELSGVWETSNGHGGAVGIHLTLSTSIDADTHVSATESWESLGLGVFERKGAELVFGEANYFGDSLRAGSVKLADDRLELHFAAPQSNRSQAQIEALRAAGIEEPTVDLDLTRQRDGCWHGRFHRGNFDSVLSLCRPVAAREAAVHQIVGTWSNGRGGCVHIFETGSGAYLGWADSREVPGQIVFSRSYPVPHRLYHSYGELAKVHLENNGETSVEFGAYRALCCSHLFVGTLSDDGTTLRGHYPPGLNQAPHPGTWTKLRGGTCMEPTLSVN
jgi:hypothetical protein